jgi:hypothetical protein
MHTHAGYYSHGGPEEAVLAMKALWPAIKTMEGWPEFVKMAS